jgi:uncharacterized small protein (DUF1192 family)
LTLGKLGLIGEPVPGELGGIGKLTHEPRTVPMLKVAMPAWIRNAAAALCGRRGAVTERAQEAECSRQTVYEHARRLVQQMTECDQERAALQAEVARLRAEREALQQQLQQLVPIGPEQLERFAVTSQAMGVSLRQAEELLGTLQPAKRVPDHATLGRWSEAAGRRAGEVLAVLDPLCAPAVKTLCADEIFFGG